MDEHSEPSPRRPQGGDDAERALIAAVRVALLPALALPAAVAFVGASIAGTGLQLWFACPLAVLAIAANVACWLRVIKRWRKPPRRGDDDQGWRRWSGDDSPLRPSGGLGGVTFDWQSFELQFWAHVRALEGQRELVPV
jgi:hypothetical protein